MLTSTPRRLTVIEQWAMYLTDDASPLDGLLTIDGRAPADFGQRGRSFVALWPVSRWGAEHCVEAMWLPETTRVRNLGAVRCAGREAR